MEQENKLARLLSDDLSAEELAALKADPDYALYEKIKRYSATLLIPDDKEDLLLLPEILASKQQPPIQRILYQNSWLKIAAAVLLILTAGLIYFGSGTRNVNAIAGGKSHLYLPDASEVILNATSKISFNGHQWPFRRSLQLDGEAYFKVARGKVFSVKTSMGTIRVLGTKFNVSSADRRLEVTCYEGRVEVNHLKKTVILKAGQSIEIMDEKWVRRPVSIKQPVWTQNQLIFQSATLNEVLKELEHSYDIRIKTSRRQASAKFTGTLPADNRETALKIVSDVFSLKYRLTAPGQYQLIP